MWLLTFPWDFSPWKSIDNVLYNVYIKWNKALVSLKSQSWDPCISHAWHLIAWPQNPLACVNCFFKKNFYVAYFSAIDKRKFPWLEKVERMVIAGLFHYIKQEDMRAFSEKCYTFVVMHFWVCSVTQFKFVSFQWVILFLKTKQRETTWKTATVNRFSDSNIFEKHWKILVANVCVKPVARRGVTWVWNLVDCILLGSKFRKPISNKLLIFHTEINYFNLSVMQWYSGEKYL